LKSIEHDRRRGPSGVGQCLLTDINDRSRDGKLHSVKIVPFPNDVSVNPRAAEAVAAKPSGLHLLRELREDLYWTALAIAAILKIGGWHAVIGWRNDGNWVRVFR
jgi:hypothetical protein